MEKQRRKDEFRQIASDHAKLSWKKKEEARLKRIERMNKKRAQVSDDLFVIREKRIKQSLLLPTKKNSPSASVSKPNPNPSISKPSLSKHAVPTVTPSKSSSKKPLSKKVTFVHNDVQKPKTKPKTKTKPKPKPKESSYYLSPQVDTYDDGKSISASVKSSVVLKLPPSVANAPSSSSANQATDNSSSSIFFNPSFSHSPSISPDSKNLPASILPKCFIGQDIDDIEPWDYLTTNPPAAAASTNGAFLLDQKQSLPQSVFCDPDGITMS